MRTIPQFVKDARAGMDKALESSRKEFSSIRSGKASTSLLDTVRVDAYGQSMPMSQVGSVSAPEARLLTITPMDKGLTPAIEKASRDSDLELTQQRQGGFIHGPRPARTDSSPQMLAKWAHRRA